MAKELSVGKLDKDTGDQAMTKDSATGKYMAVAATGVEALEQNIVNQNMMQERQGYRGTLRGDPTRGNPWKPIRGRDEPGLFDKGIHPRTVAMVVGLETRRVPGVREVTDIDIKTPTEAERFNRKVTPRIKVLGDTEDFPIETTLSVSG